jgi:predicted RNA methylase
MDIARRDGCSEPRRIPDATEESIWTSTSDGMQQKRGRSGAGCDVGRPQASVTRGWCVPEWSGPSAMTALVPRLSDSRTDLLREVAGWFVASTDSQPTSGSVSTAAVSTLHTTCRAWFTPYQATLGIHFQSSLRTLAIDRRKHTFIDLGSGKGTVLFFAVKAGFPRVIGVELARALVDVARQNVPAFEDRHPGLGGRIEVVSGDATGYQLPTGPTVVFLYNPFGQEALCSVLIQAESALEASGSTMYLIYVNLVFGETIDERPSFQLVKRARKWATYRSVAQRRAASDSRTLGGSELRWQEFGDDLGPPGFPRWLS